MSSYNKSHVLNPWILFSNQFYNFFHETERKIKHKDAMRLAMIGWDSMTISQKSSWYLSYLKEEQALSHLKESISDSSFIIDASLSWINLSLFKRV